MRKSRLVRATGTTTALALLLSALVGCATPPRLPGPNLVGGGLNERAERLILVTIANPGGAMLSEPGSTPRGYDVIGPYAVSDQARAVTAALEREYGLQEVRAWPIAPLGVQCLVFALPPEADRAELLRRLAADRRVRVTQPMQVFDALGGHDSSGQLPATTSTTFGASSGSLA